MYLAVAALSIIGSIFTRREYLKQHPDQEDNLVIVKTAQSA